MMNIFRKLAGNLFFKIILGFVALSFVLFGISGFILGNPNSWVVKVGSKTVGYSSFVKEMQAGREMILASNSSPEAMQYLESQRFKIDILNRIVNRAMMEKLRADFGVEPSKKLILTAVAKNPNFKKDGKFDRDAFRKFLAKNGLNEERYVEEVSNEIAGALIIESLTMASIANPYALTVMEQFRQEKRVADVITISAKNLDKISAASLEDLEKFFARNKEKYVAPELRKVSFISFAKADLAKDLEPSKEELMAEYEKNKEQFSKPESRDFFNLVFDEEKSAQEFLAKLGSDKTKLSAQFVSLAKEVQKKDEKAILLKNITKADLIPEITTPIFEMKEGDLSKVIKTPLGFHVLLLKQVNKPQPIAFADVQEALKKKLRAQKEEKFLQEKIGQIDDAILTSNSLEDAAKKFGLKVLVVEKINQNGQDENGRMIADTVLLDDFAKNAFAAKKDQASKVFLSPNSQKFYALKVSEIIASHQQTLAEVKSKVVADFDAERRVQALHDLVKKVEDEVKANPQNAAQIAAKHKVKFEKAREFSRITFVNYQGRQMPYQSKFTADLFLAKLGEVTMAAPSNDQEFTVGILREVKKFDENKIDRAKATKEEQENFRNQNLQEFNKFVVARHPIKTNDKILAEPQAK